MVWISVSVNRGIEYAIASKSLSKRTLFRPEVRASLRSRYIPVIVRNLDFVFDNRTSGGQAHGIGWSDSRRREVMPDGIVSRCKVLTLQFKSTVKTGPVCRRQSKARIRAANIANQ